MCCHAVHTQRQQAKYLTVTDVLSTLPDKSFHYRQQLVVFNLNNIDQFLLYILPTIPTSSHIANYMCIAD